MLGTERDTGGEGLRGASQGSESLPGCSSGAQAPAARRVDPRCPEGGGRRDSRSQFSRPCPPAPTAFPGPQVTGWQQSATQTSSEGQGILQAQLSPSGGVCTCKGGQMPTGGACRSTTLQTCTHPSREAAVPLPRAPGHTSICTGRAGHRQQLAAPGPHFQTFTCLGSAPHSTHWVTGDGSSEGPVGGSSPGHCARGPGQVTGHRAGPDRATIPMGPELRPEP